MWCCSPTWEHRVANVQPIYLFRQFSTKIYHLATIYTVKKVRQTEPCAISAMSPKNTEKSENIYHVAAGMLHNVTVKNAKENKHLCV